MWQRLRTAMGLDEEWERPRPRIGRADIVAAAVTEVVIITMLELTRAAGFLPESSVPIAGQWVLSSLGAVLLVFRRRWPLLVAIAASVHMFGVGLSVTGLMASAPMQVVYFVAFMSAVAWARDRAAMGIVVSILVVFMFAWLSWQFALGSALDTMRQSMAGGDAGGSFAAWLTLIVGTNIAYFGGAIALGQHLWWGALHQARLAEQATTIAEQSDRMQEQAVTSERLRIAREIHDVVGHHVAAIGIHAGGARRVAERSGGTHPQVLEALNTISTQSREAVEQMRFVVRSLRDANLDQPSDEPAGGLADLEQLLRSTERPGVRVTLDQVVTIDPHSVPHQVGHTIFRTVQESLTNVAKHSTASSIRVTLRLDPDAAEVEVLDDGRPRHGTGGSGLGHIGIRERVRATGGTVDIGPRVTGGYRVRVTLPLAHRAAAAHTTPEASKESP